MSNFSHSSENKQKFSEVHHFKIPKSIKGDEIEKEENNTALEKVTLRDQLIYRPVDLKESYLPATPVVGKMINLKPKVTINNKKNHTNVRITKEPKFVPYEPYKAATNPIIQNKKTRLPKLSNVSDLKIEDLIHLKSISISEVLKTESNQSKMTAVKMNGSPEWKEEKQTMLIELNRLKKENSDLQNQVEYQAQVNAEIKKLLVAAVGEDIETRVQLLAEDKLHLAKQLLNTAKTLSTHQEQIEWLAGQSEVWRSKFLSSSMLVEDLARWKAGLCQKLTAYEKSLKKMLEDYDKMRQDAFHTFINLSTLQEKFNLDIMPQDSQDCQRVASNVVDLCTSNFHLSELLFTQLLRDRVAKKKFELDPLNNLTLTEKEVQMVLSQPMVTLRHSDIACSAVMTGAALALSSASPHCSHCNGTVKTV